MECKYRGIACRIERNRIEVSGDESPDTETVVKRILTFVCRNPQCGHCGEEVGETEIKIN